MKSILFCIGMMSTASLFAQKVEIGLNGGIGFNTNPNITADGHYSFPDGKSSRISPVAAVKAMLNRNKWQYGIQVDYRKLSYQALPLFAFGGVSEPAHTATVYISKAAIPFKAFINRKITYGRLETYAGISAGCWLATKCEDPEALLPDYFDHVNGNGFSVGLQGGGTYYITKRMGVNAEVNGDLLWLTVGAASYRLIDFLVILGIRYRL